MNFSDKHKVYRVLFWLSVAVLFAAPLEVFHFLLSILHTLFEWLEASLDFMIDVLFDTTLHKTQIVVFYILIAIFVYGFYRLWQNFPRFYNQKQEQLARLLSDETVDILVYWQGSIVNKLKLLSVVLGLIFLLFL